MRTLDIENFVANLFSNGESGSTETASKSSSIGDVEKFLSPSLVIDEFLSPSNPNQALENPIQFTPSQPPSAPSQRSKSHHSSNALPMPGNPSMVANI